MNEIKRLQELAGINEIKINPPNGRLVATEMDEDDEMTQYEITSPLDSNISRLGESAIEWGGDITIPFYMEEGFEDEDDAEDLEYFKNFLKKYNIPFDISRDGDIAAWIKINKKHFTIK